MFMIVILGQMLAIASLSIWIYVEYLNNLYLREYVSDFVQTEGWIVGVLVVAVALGSLTGLFLKRPVKRLEPVETVSTEARIAVPLPRAVTEAREKSDSGFHPAVAALMADIAGRRTAFAEPSVPRQEEPRTVLTFKEWGEGTQVIGPTANLNAAVTSPRLDQPPSLVPEPAVPIAETNEVDRSTAANRVTRASPTLPRHVTTVITGIIPSQRKKEPDSSEKDSPS